MSAVRPNGIRLLRLHRALHHALGALVLLQYLDSSLRFRAVAVYVNA
jgi:hypothetical protein